MFGLILMRTTFIATLDTFMDYHEASEELMVVSAPASTRRFCDSLHSSMLSAACICLKSFSIIIIIEEITITYLMTDEKAYGITVTVMNKVIRRIKQVGRICLMSW